MKRSNSRRLALAFLVSLIYFVFLRRADAGTKPDRPTPPPNSSESGSPRRRARGRRVADAGRVGHLARRPPAPPKPKVPPAVGRRRRVAPRLRHQGDDRHARGEACRAGGRSAGTRPPPKRCRTSRARGMRPTGPSRSANCSATAAASPATAPPRRRCRRGCGQSSWSRPTRPIEARRAAAARGDPRPRRRRACRAAASPTRTSATPSPPRWLERGGRRVLGGSHAAGGVRPARDANGRLRTAVSRASGTSRSATNSSRRRATTRRRSGRPGRSTARSTDWAKLAPPLTSATARPGYLSRESLDRLHEPLPRRRGRTGIRDGLDRRPAGRADATCPRRQQHDVVRVSGAGPDPRRGAAGPCATRRTRRLAGTSSAFSAPSAGE